MYSIIVLVQHCESLGRLPSRTWKITKSQSKSSPCIIHDTVYITNKFKSYDFASVLEEFGLFI